MVVRSVHLSGQRSDAFSPLTLPLGPFQRSQRVSCESRTFPYHAAASSSSSSVSSTRNIMCHYLNLIFFRLFRFGWLQPGIALAFFFYLLLRLQFTTQETSQRNESVSRHTTTMNLERTKPFGILPRHRRARARHRCKHENETVSLLTVSHTTRDRERKREKTRREIIFDLIKGYFTCFKIQWTMFSGARTKSKCKQPATPSSPTTTPMMIGKNRVRQRPSTFYWIKWHFRFFCSVFPFFASIFSFVFVVAMAIERRSPFAISSVRYSIRWNTLVCDVNFSFI